MNKCNEYFFPRAHFSSGNVDLHVGKLVQVKGKFSHCRAGNMEYDKQ